MAKTDWVDDATGVDPDSQVTAAKLNAIGVEINSIGEIDLAERSAAFDVQAVGITATFVEGLLVTVPPQTRPYAIEFDAMAQHATGTAASGSVNNIQAFLNEFELISTDTLYGTAVFSSAAGAVTNRTWQGAMRICRRFPPNAATKYYRITSRLAIAAISGWAGSHILGADPPTSGTYHPMKLRAVGL
jgi:hypothetical protein